MNKKSQFLFFSPKCAFILSTVILALLFNLIIIPITQAQDLNASFESRERKSVERTLPWCIPTYDPWSKTYAEYDAVELYMLSANNEFWQDFLAALEQHAKEEFYREEQINDAPAPVSLPVQDLKNANDYKACEAQQPPAASYKELTPIVTPVGTIHHPEVNKTVRVNRPMSNMIISQIFDGYGVQTYNIFHEPPSGGFDYLNGVNGMGPLNPGQPDVGIITFAEAFGDGQDEFYVVAYAEDKVSHYLDDYKVYYNWNRFTRVDNLEILGWKDQNCQLLSDFLIDQGVDDENKLIIFSAPICGSHEFIKYPLQIEFHYPLPPITLDPALGLP